MTRISGLDLLASLNTFLKSIRPSHGSNFDESFSPKLHMAIFPRFEFSLSCHIYERLKPFYEETQSAEISAHRVEDEEKQIFTSG